MIDTSAIVGELFLPKPFLSTFKTFCARILGYINFNVQRFMARRIIMGKKTNLTKIAAPVILAAGVATVSEKLFSFVFDRVDKVPATSADKQQYAESYFDGVDWLHDQPDTEQWLLNANNKSKRLTSTYVPAEVRTTDTVIIAHGYKGNGETMSSYARMFHELGYNVLLPDNRAHGSSAGKYITFGWLDRLDYLNWIDKIIEKNGRNSRIVLFGVSMGGATVEMVSGETLPEQVRAIIADCGYSNIGDELSYLLKRTFHLPKYPFVPAVNLINHRRQGFDLKSVSSVDQLKKNTRPIFFIHGEKDVYVPAEMLNENFVATSAPKEKWLVPNATHAESFWINPEEYKQHVDAFLDEYLTYQPAK